MTGPPTAAARPAGTRRDGLPLWAALVLLLAFGTLLARGGAPGTAAVLEWQPALAGAEPWRWWSAAWVHYSGLHLAANLAGLVLVAALGWAAAVDRAGALAWGLAWPLTHLGLCLQPSLTHYGGLSGVLHCRGRRDRGHALA